MFGESDSESPRVPSPWDSLTSAGSSPPKYIGTLGIPKLVPEAEEGNVEYKLQLLSPSPARFARLVTQLKWRLLEGGGQAYYEIGVADSGTLVGLPRQQLEESLETLEMMAGEIGASVIVVKEIEVPLELSSLAESQLERWDGKRNSRRKDRLRMMKQGDESPITPPTEFETEFSNTDGTDAEESTCTSPPISPSSLPAECNSTQSRSPPNPLPFDSALALFTMDVGEDVANYADSETLDDDVPTDCAAGFSVSLEISSVYKPRPMKKRASHTGHVQYTKKRLKNGYPPSKFTETTCHSGDPIAQAASEALTEAGGIKSQLRKDRRDKRRELKSNTLLIHAPIHHSTESPTHSADHNITPPCSTDEADSCTPDSPLIAVIDPPILDALETTITASKEPRLIVEALVVRKLSLDEAFLDFEGFSLQ